MTDRTQAAAAEIAALINSRPVSPRQDEIEAIIAKIATPATSIMGDAVHRAAWDAVASATKAAYAKAIEIEDTGGTSEAIEAADAAADAANSRMDECARRIIDTPVRSWSDVALLAMVFFRMLWTGKNLTDPDADAELANGPHNGVEGIGLDALAALLKGIRELALPQASTVSSDLPLAPCGRLERLGHSIAAVERVEADIGGRVILTKDDDAALRVVDDKLEALTKEIWASPVRTFADLQERAMVARHWHRPRCDRDDGDCVHSRWQHPDEIDDIGERAVGYLIDAVLKYGAPSADLWQYPTLQEASAAIRAWHGAFTKEDISGAADAAREAGIAAAHDNLKAAAQRIWDTPPTSWADVAACALIFETWSDQVEDGVLVYLDPAELTRVGSPPHCDLSAMAHLLDAIRKVSGANGPLLDAVGPRS